MSIKKPTIEALKEGGRLLLMLVVSFAVSFLLEKVVPTLDQNQTTLAFTITLRMIDKWIHKNPKFKFSGLAPF